MKYKNANRKLWLAAAFLSIAALVTASYLGWSAQAARPQQQPSPNLKTTFLNPAVAALATVPKLQKNDPPQIEPLASAKCEANYYLDNAGTITTGWKNLGNVSGLNKKQKCKIKAEQNGHYAKEKLLQYAPVGSSNFLAICNAGKLCVGFDSRVEGKTYTKDGGACTPVGCTKPNCPWNGYQ